MRRVVAVALVAVAATVPAAAGGSAQQRDYAAVALNVLPPGQSGDLRFPPTATDQLKLYDAQTPKGATVSARDLARLYKPERFGVTGKVVRVERPRAGVRIRFGILPQSARWTNRPTIQQVITFDRHRRR